MKLISALAFSAVVFPAHAETIITCEAGKGWSYYPESPSISAEMAGWHEDGISDGTITFVTVDDSVDVLIKDSMGVISARSDGADVGILSVSDPFVTVIAKYPHAVELYTINTATRVLMWSQHKFADISQKAHTFVGPCE